MKEVVVTKIVKITTSCKVPDDFDTSTLTDESLLVSGPYLLCDDFEVLKKKFSVREVEE